MRRGPRADEAFANVRASVSKMKMCSARAVPMHRSDRTPSLWPMSFPSQSRTRYADRERMAIAFDTDEGVVHSVYAGTHKSLDDIIVVRC